MSEPGQVARTFRYRRRYAAKYGYSTKAAFSDGGLRERVLQRDRRRCIRCGMTDAEHRQRWRYGLTVDHIDKDRRNNELANLQTLCLRCHARKDHFKSTLEIKKYVVLYRRAIGETYQSIADSFGVNYRTIWNLIHRWEAEAL